MIVDWVVSAERRFKEIKRGRCNDPRIQRIWPADPTV